MPSPSSWSATDVRRGTALSPPAASRPLLAAVLLLVVSFLGAFAPAGAATVLEKHVRHEIGADDSVMETTRLRVRIDTAADRDTWATYDIYLDEHRELQDVTARVVSPTGSVQEVKKKEQDLLETGAGGLHSSVKLHRLNFPALPTGAVVEITSRVRSAPYFPGGRVYFAQGGDTVARLTVELAGAPVTRGSDFRWQVSGPAADLKLEEGSGVLRWVGEGLETDTPPDLAPGDTGNGPVLRYAWGPAATWAGVGSWYQGLLGDLPPVAESVRSRARELTRGLDDPRDKVEALLAQARGPVRYVAVEVGVGGYRPSPPGVTLERGWGDCKDKSLLLVEMLREVGVAAFPALILLDDDEHVDPAFPTAQVFNHLIVAVSTEGMELVPTDPVSEGLLFVDPTHEKGDSRWLHAGVQDQNALVIRPDGSKLVTTPLLAAENRQLLELHLGVDTAGQATGEVKLTLSGEYGSWIEEMVAASPADRVEELLRTIFGRLLPGVEVAQVGWGVEDGATVPTALLYGEVTVRGLIPGTGDRLSFQLPGLGDVPEASLVDDRELPVVLLPGVREERWRVQLPRAGCASASDDVSAESPAGLFEQTLSVDGRELSLDRRLAWNDRWIEPDGFEGFREVALTARRARLRRLRLECGGS